LKILRRSEVTINLTRRLKKMGASEFALVVLYSIFYSSELLRYHTRTKTKRRENPKSYKRWDDHFPSVYRLSHA
jgi:hypothetical protein